MRIVVLTLAAMASAAIASPAMAGEGRIETRGGIIWGGGAEEAVAGVAAGYDWDLGDTAFAGVEISGDKVLVSGADISTGFTGRAGIKPAAGTKLYVDGGYTLNSYTTGDDTPHLGAGVEQAIAGNFYGKLAYRHHFSDLVDADTLAVGFGLNF